jgi:anthranilate phosphoribosyltransferase
MKGETVTEVAAAASVMRRLATAVDVSDVDAVDVVGTGGDGVGTFNISTAAAFVAAGAGAKVAKHGNRSVSSTSGSAEVLLQAGASLNLTPDSVGRCVREVGFGFMFAPNHHAAMRHAIGPRREMGVRTIFNVLGPLTNPAGAKRQLIGVFSMDWVEPLANVLLRLGSTQAMVASSADGLDEISIGDETYIAELRDGKIETRTIKPEDFGIPRSPVDSLVVASPAESLAVVNAVLDGEPGPAADIVLLNAGASIYVAGLAASFEAGVAMARESIASGAARDRLRHYAALTNELAEA